MSIVVPEAILDALRNGPRIIGYRRNGCPIYSIGGGSVDVDTGQDDADTDDDSDDDDSDDDGADEPVTFASQKAFQDTIDKIVKNRVNRVKKKYEPDLNDYATLKKKVADGVLIEKGTESNNGNQSPVTDPEIQRQLNELLGYKRENERKELVRDIAKEKGLPEIFLDRVTGDSEDDIESDIDDLLETLKSAGATGEPAVTTKTKRRTRPKSKDEDTKGKGRGSGEGDDDDDEKIDVSKLISETPRYGLPYVVR